MPRPRLRPAISLMEGTEAGSGDSEKIRSVFVVCNAVRIAELKGPVT